MSTDVPPRASVQATFTLTDSQGDVVRDDETLFLATARLVFEPPCPVIAEGGHAREGTSAAVRTEDMRGVCVIELGLNDSSLGNWYDS